MDNVSIVLGSVASLVAVIAFVLSLRKTNKTNGREEGQILTEIGYIKSGVDDIKKRQDKQQEEYIEIRLKMAEIETSTRHAHERIDRLEADK